MPGSITSSPWAPRRRKEPRRGKMIAERRAYSVSLQPPRRWAQCRSRTLRSGVVSSAAELSISVQALHAGRLDRGGMPWRLLTLLLIGQLLASMDASILTVATPVLQHELDASPTMLQAIFAAYTFTFGVLVVTGARLGDERGHGNMFLAGLLGFTLSSLVCGLAPTAPVLLAGRLVQGACGALMTPQTLQVIQRRFVGAARTKAVGVYSLVLSVGVLVGQLVGGVVVTTVGWRWALLVNVPLGTALLAAAFPLLRG